MVLNFPLNFPLDITLWEVKWEARLRRGFLLSDYASFITGSYHLVDSGEVSQVLFRLSRREDLEYAKKV